MRIELNYEGVGEQSKQFICQNFQSLYHDHHQWRSETRRERELFKGKETQRGQREEKEEKEEEETYYRKNPKRVGPPSRRLTLVHMMEYRVPHLGFDVGTKVLVEALARTAIASFYLQGLSDF